MYRKSSALLWRNSKKNFRLFHGNHVKGTIESFTKVYVAPKDFEGQVPYFMALILLDNGEKLVSQVVDCEKLDIGARVEPCIRRVYNDGDDGIICYGAKFKVIK